MKNRLIISGMIVLSGLQNVLAALTTPHKAIRQDARMQATGCSPSTAITDLDIGNVRASILIDGDMWWDLVGNAGYEVPKGSGKHSLFTGALWIGGKDTAGNLFVSAQTYHQNGSDFWPGPLDTTDCSISATVCNTYNRHWKITRQEVLDFVVGGPPSATIQSWPGNGDPLNNQDHYLAPYVDVNNDGIYNYQDGDYPAYNFTPGTGNCPGYLQGDQTIWWVFNDKGNLHTESGSLNQFGFEIHAQAFAFSTLDSNLANTTFYNYQIINRCSQAYYKCTLGQFVDPDLGYSLDDYVGCDVSRGFGYAYNGDSIDDLPVGYGSYPPAVGVDFLQGPQADPGDGIDNNRNGITDEQGERIMMSNFMCYENNFTAFGNPTNAQHYYNYMRGIWKSGDKLVYGGNGFQTVSPGGDSCDFMLPGNSDPLWWGTHGKVETWPWSETIPLPGSLPNVPGDRRFIMSCGPFTMVPGEVQEITTAAMWARAYAPGLMASVDSLRIVDDLIHSFFNSCYTNIPTSISTIDKISSSVFPNPATDEVTFRFFNQNIQSVDLEIFSVDGRMVYSGKNFSQHDIRINTETFAPGIYFYHIHTDKAGQSAGKFMVVS